MLRKLPWMLAELLLPSMMLAGCATLTQATSPGTPTPSGKPGVCLSMDQIQPNRGKPKKLGPITVEEIEAQLDRDNPIDRVRNFVGDNTATLTQIDKNNAALASICK